MTLISPDRTDLYQIVLVRTGSAGVNWRDPTDHPNDSESNIVCGSGNSPVGSGAPPAVSNGVSPTRARRSDGGGLLERGRRRLSAYDERSTDRRTSIDGETCGSGSASTRSYRTKPAVRVHTAGNRALVRGRRSAPTRSPTIGSGSFASVRRVGPPSLGDRRFVILASGVRLQVDHCDVEVSSIRPSGRSRPVSQYFVMIR